MIRQRYDITKCELCGEKLSRGEDGDYCPNPKCDVFNLYILGYKPIYGLKRSFAEKMKEKGG